MKDFFKQVLLRSERAFLGLISKKFVAWYVSTYLLYKGYIAGSEWVMLTAAIFALQIVQNRYATMGSSQYGNPLNMNERRNRPVAPPQQGDTDDGD